MYIIYICAWYVHITYAYLYAIENRAINHQIAVLVHNIMIHLPSVCQLSFAVFSDMVRLWVTMDMSYKGTRLDGG